MPTEYSKYQVVINGTTVLEADGMGWDYPQTDGEGSGATDENLMYREVLPERDKITLSFSSDTSEATVRTILGVRALVSCSVNFWDLRSGTRVTKTMYPVSDEIKAKSLMKQGNNSTPEFIVEPFELRFIQIIPNS